MCFLQWCNNVRVFFKFPRNIYVGLDKREFQGWAKGYFRGYWNNEKIQKKRKLQYNIFSDESSVLQSLESKWKSGLHRPAEEIWNL